MVRHELVSGCSGALLAFSRCPVLPLDDHHGHMPPHLPNILADNPVSGTLQVQLVLLVPILLKLIDLLLDIGALHNVDLQVLRVEVHLADPRDLSLVLMLAVPHRVDSFDLVNWGRPVGVDRRGDVASEVEATADFSRLRTLVVGRTQFLQIDSWDFA